MRNIKLQKNSNSMPNLFKDQGLTKKATFNAIASALDYGSRLLVGFFIQPIMVSGLGDFYYGVWQILLRSMGYLSPASGRATQALKMVLANQQSSSDYEQKRQYVGSTLIVWLMFLPLTATLGGLLTWYLPVLIKSPQEYYLMIRLASAVLVLNLVCTNLVSVPRSVLEGENLGYKRMGLSALLVIFGGGLTWLAIILNTGLIGVAASLFIVTLISGLFYLWVVRSYAPWYGVARSSWKETYQMLGLSWWFVAWNLIMNLMTASDVIILGLLVSVQTVTDYSLSKYAPETVISFVAIMAFGIAPGLGGIIGSKEYAKAARVRGEIMSLTWLVVTVLGTLVLLWNRAFIDLWVGGEHFIGGIPNILIVLVILQFVLIRNDGNIIDLSLQLKRKVIMGAISVGLSLGIAVALVSWLNLGVAGLCLGLIAGRLILSFGYPIYVGRLLGVTFSSQLKSIIRPTVVTLVLFSAAIYLDNNIFSKINFSIDTWVFLILAAGISFIGIFGLAFYFGLKNQQRKSIVQRIRIVFSKVGKE